MGQENSERVSHAVSDLPVWGRDDQLYQLINDLFEEDAGQGYSQITRSGGFITGIICWATVAMLTKRSEITITRTGSFVSQIVKQVYLEDGSGVVSTTTMTVTRAINNTATFVNIGVTRP